jgi:hypothetical protein
LVKLFFGACMKNSLPSLKVSTLLIFIAVAGLLFSSHAFAGVLINFEITDLKAPPQEKKGMGRLSADTNNSLLKFENDRIKRDEMSTMIFNQKKQVLEMYDHQNKQKRVMDKKSSKEMQEKMQGYKKQFDDMMKNMTEEQRNMMQQMGRGPQPPGSMQDNSGSAEMKYVKTSKRDKAMRLPCTVYDVFIGSGEKQLEMCVTNLSNIPDGKAVKKLMGELGEFYKEIFSSMPMGPERKSTPFEDFKKVDGFPIKTTRFENGKPIEVTTLTSVKKAKFKPEDFNPFPDYPAMGMMDAGRGKTREMRRRSRMPKRPDGMEGGPPGDSMSPPPGYPVPGQTPGQPLDLQKLLEGLQQRRR